MVKAGEDYKNRKDDSRFKKWDDSTNSVNDIKKSRVLIIGLTVLLSWIIISAMFSLMAGKSPVSNIPGAEPTTPFEEGLNITYDPVSSIYIVQYNNVLNTTERMRTYVYSDDVPFIHFENMTSDFPANITYKPYAKDLHTHVVVVLMKPTGNYTYSYGNIPLEDEKTTKLTSSYEDMIKPVKDIIGRYTNQS